jgi:NTE family protein
VRKLAALAFADNVASQSLIEVSRVATTGHSFFEGLTDSEVVSALEGAEPRRYPAGSIVIAEGDSPREIYIIQDGAADIFVSDRSGAPHRINRVGPGSSVGEMSVFTGHPASASVQAISELSVLVLSEEHFFRIAAAYPIIYRNLGAILSQRLARSNRRTLGGERGRATILVSHDAPPTLGYALACSMAWHTRASTIFIVLGQGELPNELAALTSSQPLHEIERGDEGRPHIDADGREPGARLAVAAPVGVFGPDALPGTLADLAATHRDVVVQVTAAHGEVSTGNLSARTLHLYGERVERQASGYVAQGWASTAAVRPDRAGILRVPAPNASDLDAMRRGLLPATSAHGKAVAWAARELTEMQVGLALGAGSVKGYAHIGALRVLERAGVIVDYVAGTSVGAAIASMFALGYRSDAILDALTKVGDSAFRLAVPTSSILSNAGLRAGLKTIGGEMHIEDVPLPLAVVAADILSREEIVLRNGLLWEAVLASMAIPGIYPPLRIGKHLLVDGGILNPVPSNVTAEMGGDILIGVKLASRYTAPAVTTSSKRGPMLLEVLHRSIEIMQSYIVADTASAATILIEPAFEDVAGFGLRGFSQSKDKFVELGEAATEAALPRIAAALPWLRA